MSWTKHTKKNASVGDYKLEKSDYIKPADALARYGAKVKILGGYINRGAKLGAHPVIFIETPDGVRGLDLNKNYTDQWEAIFTDPDDIATIERGEAFGELVPAHNDFGDYVAFQI